MKETTCPHLFTVDAVPPLEAVPATFATPKTRGAETIARDWVTQGGTLTLALLPTLVPPVAIGTDCKAGCAALHAAVCTDGSQLCGVSGHVGGQVCQ